MSPYCLYCTVCKDHFNSPLEWNAHLPEINHQRRAKLQCRKWKALNKECVVVVFGSCPVVECGLVQLLSGMGGGFVTDFIYWRKKPNIGLLQFESSDSVEEVLKKTGPEIWLDDINRVQLRKAVEYFELEWNFLFSLSSASNLELSNCNNDDLSLNTTTINKEKTAKKRKARKSSANESSEVIVKKKRKESSSQIEVSSENQEVRKKCQTKNNEETISKKTKKVKAPAKSTEGITIIPSKNKSLKTPTEGQSICEQAINISLNIATPGLATSETSSELTPKLSKELETSESNPNQTDQRISAEAERNIEGASNNCSPTNCDQSDTNSTDTEVVILSSDESDAENNIVTEENLEHDMEQQNPIPNNDNSDFDDDEEEDNVEVENTILSSFRKEYISLIQDILIPSDEYEKATNLIEMLESEFKKTVPECRVIPFRHWHLGIKSAGTNELLLFLDHTGIWGKEEWDEVTYIQARPSIINQFFQSPEVVFSEIEKISKHQSKKSIDPNEESFGIEFLHKSTGLKFRVINSLLLLYEVQTCRLIEYLCEFDPVVLPLLGLLNYWANVNSLMFGNLRVTNPSNPFVSPFPASLNWFVLLFLMAKKVIPSTRQILSKPHKKIMWEGKDIGFSNDPSYPKAWSSLTARPLSLPEQIAQLRNPDDIDLYSIPRILRMLHLVKDFFTFYRTKIFATGFEQGIIFNPKDGCILTKSERLKKNLKLDSLERKFLQKLRFSPKYDVYILHPIDFSKFSLSFNNEIFKDVFFPLMRLTMRKIRKFLSKLRKGKFCETSLSQSFKVSRDKINKNGKIKAKSRNVKKVKPKKKKKQAKSKSKKKNA